MAVRVKGFDGAACVVIGRETVKVLTGCDCNDCDECAEYGPRGNDPEDYEDQETGRLIIRMIGDDHRYTVDPEDVSPLDDSAFCYDCGQIGCFHNVIETA